MEAARGGQNPGDKLEREIGPVEWRHLHRHFLRGAVIIVSDDLDLVKVGIDVAGDNAAQIRAWMDEGKISKPSVGEVEVWQKENPAFLSLIISPFVLVQERSGQGCSGRS